MRQRKAKQSNKAERCRSPGLVIVCELPSHRVYSISSSKHERGALAEAQGLHNSGAQKGHRGRVESGSRYEEGLGFLFVKHVLLSEGGERKHGCLPDHIVFSAASGVAHPDPI